MKLLTILLGTAITATFLYTLYINQPSISYVTEMNEFNNFKKNFNKQYLTVGESEYRFKIFQENYRKIQEWKKTRTFSVGVNQFSDLTWTEFSNSYLMDSVPNKINRNPIKAEDIDIDWREKNIVSGVKD